MASDPATMRITPSKRVMLIEEFSLALNAGKQPLAPRCSDQFFTLAKKES